jgi:hypothetical protein
MKQQKLEDLKLQVMGQNPQLLGLGQPPSDEQEIGGDAAGPTANPAPPAEGGQPPAEEPQAPPPEAEGDGPSGNAGQPPQGPEASTLPEPSEDEINKYNLKIRSYSREIDEEEVDPVELGEA